MSDFKVSIERVGSTSPLANADRLELAMILGWQVVVGKGTYTQGDLCVYFPIDSVLPASLEALIFAGSKVKLYKSRIKSIRLRGALSQGLAVDPKLLGLDGLPEGTDVTETLGVTKYEPPITYRGANTQEKSIRRLENPHFHVYQKFPNVKNVPAMFSPGDVVVVTEKIHGTNFRAGWVKFYPVTWWGKIKKFFGFAPEWEFVYGSHRVQYCYRARKTGFYKTNVYQETVDKYGLKERIPKGVVIYGEIYGDGIQKGFTYGCAPEERRLVIFDVMVDEQYVDYITMRNYCHLMHLEPVPELGCFSYNETIVKELARGPSRLGPQMVREGCVARTVLDGHTRKIAKFINDDYYDLQEPEEVEYAH